MENTNINEKSKIIKLMISVIILIVIALVGTYALSIWRSQENTELTLRIGDISGFYCTKGDNIEISNIGPIFDYTIDGESTTFSVDNQTNEVAKVSVKFHITTLTDNLKEESFKYVLMTNTDNSSYTVYKEGNFKDVTNGSSITLLDNYEVALSSKVSFKLVIYIDGNMENPITMQGGSLVGYLDACKEEDPNAGLDNSGANRPVLVDGLIPVVYDESTSTWVKADTTSSTSTYGWYDYDNKKWANAVLVSSTNRSTYQSASTGTTIADADILAFYVWIPRYKYKVWNINKEIMQESNYVYNAKTEGIDIVFEDSTSSTGTISCTYSYEAPSSTAGSPNEVCTGSNGDYYTHPAFTFGTQELKGFWMGKFELSSNTPSETNGGGSSITLTPRILPNVTSGGNNALSNFWKVIYDMQTSNNIYGLSTSRTNTDSHMITNMEWGAVAYLTNSKYGRCTNENCTEVTINNCSTYITGIGADEIDAVKSATTCTTASNKYNGTKGVFASTTGNIYGVYDMSGGADEYVMGNVSSSNGTTYTYNVKSAGANFTYSTNTSKYLTTYAYGTTLFDQTAYNRGRLGDATSEVILPFDNSSVQSLNYKQKIMKGVKTISFKNENEKRGYIKFLKPDEKRPAGWYDDEALFPTSTSSWFLRGGAYENHGDVYTGIWSSGLFSFDYTNGSNTYYDSTRAVLSPIS